MWSQFQPGQAHYHNIMEENFHILQGKVDLLWLTAKVHTLSATIP